MGALEIIVWALGATIIVGTALAAWYAGAMKVNVRFWIKQYNDCRVKLTDCVDDLNIAQGENRNLRHKMVGMTSDMKALQDELAAVKAELDLYKNHEAETRVMGRKVRISTPGTIEQGGKAVINVKGLDSEEGERYDCVFTHNGELYRCFLYIQPYADMLMSRNPEQTIPALDNYEAHVIKF